LIGERLDSFGTIIHIKTKGLKMPKALTKDKCPSCKKEVLSNQDICPYCQEDLKYHELNPKINNLGFFNLISEVAKYILAVLLLLGIASAVGAIVNAGDTLWLFFGALIFAYTLFIPFTTFFMKSIYNTRFVKTDPRLAFWGCLPSTLVYGAWFLKPQFNQ
jgi:hypothetical protein